jgi:alkanesulfonate monooxygenase SsuD/methylene tetrahydromethanopterin reductase-like flavin-dependent oxidoreductase (luciferase family)
VDGGVTVGGALVAAVPGSEPPQPTVATAQNAAAQSAARRGCKVMRS